MEQDKRIFISMPMRGKEEKTIASNLKYATKLVEEDGRYSVKPSRLNLEIMRAQAKVRNVKSIPLYVLSQSLSILSQCDAILMCPGWEDARGCRIEREAARAYGLDILDYTSFGN